jgi:hypothetical protein
MLVVVVGASLVGAPVAAAGTGPDDPPPPPVTVNEFLPEDRDLSDCLSALPRPGCGSEARGGWRQGLVFGVIVAGLGVIGWRVARGVRRRDAALNPPEPDRTSPG